MDEKEFEQIAKKINCTLREARFPYYEFSGEVGYIIVDEHPLDYSTLKKMKEDPDELAPHYSFKINATFIPKPEEEILNK